MAHAVLCVGFWGYEAQEPAAQENGVRDVSLWRCVLGIEKTVIEQVEFDEDAGAVVDPDLRVKGVEGLWVADCSVFPCLASGNTNATAMMIGDKGSDHVLGAIRNAAAA